MEFRQPPVTRSTPNNGVISRRFKRKFSWLWLTVKLLFTFSPAGIIWRKIGLFSLQLVLFGEFVDEKEDLWGLLASVAALAIAGQASAANTFPPIGADTQPGFIITVGAGAGVVETGQGPYDSVKRTPTSVSLIIPTHPCHLCRYHPTLAIYSFDGDGITSSGISPNVAGNHRIRLVMVAQMLFLPT